MGNVRPKFSEHTAYYIFFLKNIIIFFSSLLFFLACLTGRRPFPCDGEATTPVTRVAAMRDLDGLERAPQMPRSTTSVRALAGGRTEDWPPSGSPARRRGAAGGVLVSSCPSKMLVQRVRKADLLFFCTL